MIDLVVSMDISGLIVVGGLSLAIGSGWFTLLLARGWPLAEVVLAACVAMWVQIILTELLLGWLHLLRPFWLLLVNMMLLIMLWVATMRTLRPYHLATYWHAVRSSLAVIRASITTQFILLLVLIWFIWTIFLGLLFPTYAFDEHYYHMPIVASILQEQHIGLISTVIPWVSAYPKNSELLVLWNTIFLHRDTVADLTMLQFWLAGGLGIYATGRRLGASMRSAWIASSIFFFCPTALIQAKTTYNDLAIGAMWAIALCFATPTRAVRTYPEGRTSTLIIGLLAGLILGTKYSGVYYVLALGLLLIPTLHASPNPGQRVQIILLFSCGVLLMGGYWYLFNFFTFANPLWPFEIRIANGIIFPGIMQISAFATSDSSLQVVGNMPFWERWWYTWSDHSVLFSVDSRLGGFGPLWFIIGFPAIILWTITAIFRRNWWVLYVVGVHGTLLILLPFNWMPRYTLFLVVLGSVSIATLYDVLLPWTRLCLSSLIVMGATLALLGSADHGYFSVQDIRYFQTLPPAQRSPVTLDPQRYGPGYQWVEHSIAPNAVVAYGNNVTLPYPLWNYTLEREVIAVTTIDSDQYVATLRAKGVHFVFLGTGGYQDAILSSDKQVHLIFEGDDGWKIFKVQ